MKNSDTSYRVAGTGFVALIPFLIWGWISPGHGLWMFIAFLAIVSSLALLLGVIFQIWE